MFCSPSSLSDNKLANRYYETKQLIIDSESDLVKKSPTLAYSQISERVGDLNRLRNFKRALVYELEFRGFVLQKDGFWFKK